ncbi:MAG: poly-beta-1,6-N-acetyl-D-glucosamine N-deacetylase PgaB, partial [Pseudomonadota bacterium]|nr:poly-beta-1,6-N-acetyl-D-glucosamine N-deacetylase PgaB [Pseudomonadota bacterium]
MIISTKLRFAAMSMLAALSACGGGATPGQSASSSNNAPITDQVSAPTITAAQLAAVSGQTVRRKSAPATQLRVVHFDLDPIFSDSDDAAQVTRNIAQMANRVQALYKPGTDLVIYLSAFSNVNATENAYDKVFFPSIHLGERGGNLRFNDAELPQGQLFARAARAIKQAAPGVKVYAWMPTMNYKLDPKSPSYADSLTSYIQSDLASEQNDYTQYKRLSPFVGVVWDIVAQIYNDLGSSAGKYIDGIVFHDDGIITDHE